MKHSEFGAALGFMPNGQYDKYACIPPYDSGELELTKSGKRVIRFHGDATYEVLGECEYGYCWHAKLIWSRGDTRMSKAIYQARAEFLCR